MSTQKELRFRWVRWRRTLGVARWEPAELDSGPPESYAMTGGDAWIDASRLELGPWLEPPPWLEPRGGGGGGLATTGHCPWCSEGRIIVDQDGKQLETCPCCGRKMTKQPTIVEPLDTCPICNRTQCPICNRTRATDRAANQRAVACEEHLAECGREIDDLQLRLKVREREIESLTKERDEARTTCKAVTELRDNLLREHGRMRRTQSPIAMIDAVRRDVLGFESYGDSLALEAVRHLVHEHAAAFAAVHMVLERLEAMNEQLALDKAEGRTE